MIAVWHALEKGIEPGPDYIRNRMRDYVRKLHRESRHAETLPLEEDTMHPDLASPYSARAREGRIAVAHLGEQ